MNNLFEELQSNQLLKINSKLTGAIKQKLIKYKTYAKTTK